MNFFELRPYREVILEPKRGDILTIFLQKIAGKISIRNIFSRGKLGFRKEKTQNI